MGIHTDSLMGSQTNFEAHFTPLTIFHPDFVLLKDSECFVVFPIKARD